MSSDRRVEVLLWQYRECLSFIRSYDSLIWQTPSITMAINSFFGILYLGYTKTFEAKIVVLIASFSFTFVAMIALQKHRFFQEARYEDLNWIQNELEKEVCNIRVLKITTREIFDDRENYRNVTRSFITCRRAYRWLLSIMYATMIIMFTLILIETLQKILTS